MDDIQAVVVTQLAKFVARVNNFGEKKFRKLGGKSSAPARLACTKKSRSRTERFVFPLILETRGVFEGAL